MLVIQYKPYPGSSVGQSNGFLIRRSEVQVLSGVPSKMLENIHKSLYCQSFGGVCLFISVLTCLVVSYLWLVYISNHKQPHVRFIVP